MYWVDFKEMCPNKAFDTKHGFICNEPSRLTGSIGVKGCIERYCPLCTTQSEDVKFSLELLGLEIKITNKRFAKMFESKSKYCKHRKTDDPSISPDECLCMKDKGIGETFCSIYSCPYINKEDDDVE
jgi:hypothetical protein